VSVALFSAACAKFANTSFAPVKLARTRLDFERLALVRFAPVKLARVRFLEARSLPDKLQWLRLAPGTKFAHLELAAEAADAIVATTTGNESTSDPEAIKQRKRERELGISDPQNQFAPAQTLLRLRFEGQRDATTSPYVEVPGPTGM
jgi:hypothetical protein